MYIQRLSVSDSEIPNSPNLRVSLIDPEAPDFFPETFLEIFQINKVEFVIEDIGTEDNPRRKFTWSFLHEDSDGTTTNGLSFIAAERSNLGHILLGSVWTGAATGYIINDESNVLQIIGETFSSINAMIEELRALQPISTPPIQPGGLNGGQRYQARRMYGQSGSGGSSFYPSP